MADLRNAESSATLKGDLVLTLKGRVLMTYLYVVGGFMFGVVLGLATALNHWWGW